MRRRRKRYTWFPVKGTFQADATDLNETYASALQVSLDITGTRVATQISPMVAFDTPPEIPTGSDTVADVVGSEYVVRRIVGKHFVACGGDGTNAEFNGALWVKAGIFVARADNQTPNIPLGADTTSIELFESFNPMSFSAVREPWLWQRSWIISPHYTLARSTIDTISARSNSNNFILAAFPQTNAHYGSVLDGPHVDVKSARRIGQDDRLYHVLAVQPLPLSTSVLASTATYRTYCLFDYRILGALRRAKQTGRF